MASQSVTFDLDATPEAVWHVVGERWGEADRTLPFVTDCRVTDGGEGSPRPGTTREVTFAARVAGADEATERLVAWHSPRSLAYETVTPTFPVSRLAWEWRVDPRGEVRSRLTVTPTVEVRGGALTGWLADSMLDDVVETLAGARDRVRATVERAARERAD
jgi:hypothetical protein